MEHMSKRTFIPPENRPKIRGAKLRSGRDSNHYLAVWDNLMRRQLFLRQFKAGLPTNTSLNDPIDLNIEEIFGVDQSLFIQLIDDVGVSQKGGV